MLLVVASYSCKLEAMMNINPHLRKHHTSDSSNKPVKRNIHIAVLKDLGLELFTTIIRDSVYFLHD